MSWIGWLLLLAGCARWPEEPIEEQARTLLTMEITVKGKINPYYYYYFVFDTDGDPTDGPIPIAEISEPFDPGNGWGTGSFTHYIEFHGGTFEVIRGGPDPSTPQVKLGPPFSFSIQERTLSVTVNLNRLKAQETDPDYTHLDLNFLTVNDLFLAGTFPPEREFDGLGLTGRQYIEEFDVRFDREISNSGLEGGTPLEMEGDVLDPDLDLMDWTIRVRHER